MYKAVGSRGSRVSRVLWMLEELGQPYEFVEVKLRSPEAYALNPSGKVPILIDGDLKVTDSAAICVYLADKHADKGMGANPGLAGRAEMDSWMHFAQSEFEAPLWNKLRHRFLLPKNPSRWATAFPLSTYCSATWVPGREPADSRSTPGASTPISNACCRVRRVRGRKPMAEP